MADLSKEKKVDWRVARRWSDELVKDGFTPIADSFLELYSGLNITNTEAMLVVHLMKYKWNDHLPYPSFNTLAKKMGLTDISVRSHARSLEKKGYLRRIGRIGETSLFDLEPLFRALEEERRKRLQSSPAK